MSEKRWCSTCDQLVQLDDCKVLYEQEGIANFREGTLGWYATDILPAGEEDDDSQL
jgi:hypothetical protein